MRFLLRFLVVLTVLFTAPCPAADSEAAPRLLAATAEHLPRWRGFNLQEKFYKSGPGKPFLESDFQLISQLGFNFVRLPMDYRVWIQDGDWTKFDEAVLQEIDQAVQWGGDYGIHVMINFHRAPGYTVAKPPEPLDLWTNPEAQRVCALHWRTFAKRYKDIPNERLSFNLFNEPSQIEPEVYVKVCRIMAEAIRAEDPKRLIVADGIEWANQPVPELRELRIAEATRGYQPMDVSHYKASWVDGQNYRKPQWPRAVAHGLLLGPAKTERKGPIVIEGDFDEDTQLRLHVMIVSNMAELVVDADGERVWEKTLTCGPGQGEWKQAVFKPEWNVYQNLFDRDYTLTIPSGSRRVEIKILRGDWLQVSEIGLAAARPGSREDVLSLDLAWGERPKPVRYTPGGDNGAFVGVEMQDREWLWRERVKPWVDLRDQGVGVMVGEFGAYNKTPHDVVLRWLEDSLANWQQAGMGWAMWNFRGSFGILDSGRQDVEYEDWEGHKLDRKLLELLQRY